jgi:dihydrofolate synthase/folylpolyglutamate synthase
LQQFNAFGYLNSLEKTKKQPAALKADPFGLMRRLLRLMGSPHEKAAAVHIAGSKGKGSVSAYIAAVYSSIGKKTLLFTSPHAFSVKERLLLDGAELDDRLWHEGIGFISSLIDGGFTADERREFSYFDILTAFAFYIAETVSADILVLETGLGGRLDKTNLCRPLAVIITTIELEHTAVLGNTLQAIATEKAGIIKDKVPVFCAYQHPESFDVISRQAALRQAPFYPLAAYVTAESFAVSYRPAQITMQAAWRYKNRAVTAEVHMLGRRQAENLALSLLFFDIMSGGRSLPAWRRAVGGVTLPGRSEVLNHKPLVLFDGGHTVESIKNIVGSFQALTAGRPRMLIFSAQTDKKIADILPLFDAFDEIIVTDLPALSDSETAALTMQVKNLYPQASFCSNPLEVIRQKIEAGWSGGILITGSFYLAQKFAILHQNLYRRTKPE